MPPRQGATISPRSFEPTTSSSRSGWSRTSSRRRNVTPISPPRCGNLRNGPRQRSAPWSMVTSAQRTSWWDRRVPSSSTRSVRGTATRRFDLAFCLNHLLLKCLWTPRATERFLDAFDTLAACYLDGVDWEPRAALEQRAARLLPGLFLARIDGKSPVEYVTEDADRDRVRATARPLLRQPVATLAAIRSAWTDTLGACP